MSRQKKRDIRKEEMFRLIDQQIKSGQSQIQFCKKQKISIATFGYWRKKYLLEKQPTVAPNFVPLKIKTLSDENSLIEIQLPNKIILRSKAWSANQLTGLILELQKTETSC